MAGMYDPFAHLTGDPWWQLARRVHTEGIDAQINILYSMRDPSLDDEWPEWSVDW